MFVWFVRWRGMFVWFVWWRGMFVWWRGMFLEDYSSGLSR